MMTAGVDHVYAFLAAHFVAMIGDLMRPRMLLR